MGSLAFYGAIGGIGKGLEQEYLLDRTTEESEAKDARTFQLERMRQQAAMDRQKERQGAESTRLKEQYGPGGYSETAAVAKEERDVISAGVQDLHEVQLEEMRQKGQTSRENMKITERNDPFDFQVTKASSTVTPAGDIITVPAQNQVTDRATNVTYTQEGLAFIPEGWDSPTESKIAAGQKAVVWLLKSADRDKARENSLIFLRTFGYLPAEYFNKFGGQGPVNKLTERGSASTSTPTNPAVQ